MSDERMVCKHCGGTGKLRYGIAGSAEKIDLGNGSYIQDMGGSGARACECVRDLPAIDGTATWWELETIYNSVTGVPIGDSCCEVEADCEIPRDERGRRVHRTRDNAHYPPLVKVMGLADATLHSDTAREIAAALIAAADACDDADQLALGEERS